MSLSRVCLFYGCRITPKELYIFYLLILLDGNFQRGKVLKLLPYFMLSHSDKVTLNIIFLGFKKKQQEYAVTSYSYYYRYNYILSVRIRLIKDVF